MVIVYGVHHFRKVKGFLGQSVACSCGNTYPRQIIRDSKWGHFEYIPLIALGSDYYSVCPVCMHGYKADKQQKKELKELMAQGGVNLHFTPHVVEHTSNKTFDLYLHDDINGTNISILQGVTKSEMKSECKGRLFKKKEIIRETAAI